MADPVRFDKAELAWTLTWDADWVSAVTFLGASRRVAAGNNLGQIVVWDLPDKAGGPAPTPKRRLDGHSNGVTRLVAPPDGRWLVSASLDHTLRVWDLEASAPTKETIVLNARAIADAEARKRNGAKVPPAQPATLDVQTASRALEGHREWVNGLDLTPDGQTLLSGDDGGEVIVWDRAAGKELRRWKVKGWAQAVALSPDAKQALVSERLPLVFDSGRHAGLALWDAAAGKPQRDLGAGYKGMHMAAAAYSRDGKTLAVARGGELDGNNGKVFLLDPASGKQTRELTPGHQYGATDLAFHPDGKHLASAGRDTVVRIWGLADGKLVKELGKPRGGQFKDWIHAISFSADGRWLAAADMAGAVQVWTFPG